MPIARTCNGALSFNCQYGYSLLADNQSQQRRGWAGLAEVSWVKWDPVTGKASVQTWLWQHQHLTHLRSKSRYCWRTRRAAQIHNTDRKVDEKKSIFSCPVSLPQPSPHPKICCLWSWYPSTILLSIAMLPPPLGYHLRCLDADYIERVKAGA